MIMGLSATKEKEKGEKEKEKETVKDGPIYVDEFVRNLIECTAVRVCPVKAETTNYHCILLSANLLLIPLI